VIADEQVLVCPQCQAAHDWRADLDRCGSCGSTMLVRALGETRCRECAWAKSAAPRRKDTDSTLADDVAAALQRRFGR
jgi:DNA-directed RNA polymerase subunit M/transcription elongation factor TFIIS